MNKNPTVAALSFLSGAGEMGKHISNKDWNGTDLGNPETWPQSLHIALGIVLHAKAPMLLLWGENYHCFPNDALYLKLNKEYKELNFLGIEMRHAFPVAWQKLQPLLNELRTSGKTASSDEPLLARHKESPSQITTATYSPIFNESGRPEGILVSISESSGNIEPTAQLENQQRLSVVVEASDLGTWEFYTKDNKVEFSERALNIIGLPTGRQPSHNDFVARLHKDDLEIRAAALKSAFKTGVLHYQARLHSNGSVRWIETRGKVFFDSDHSPQKIIGIIRDITEEKKHEKEISNREQKFRLLADSMTQQVWTANTEGKLDYFNKAVFDYSGLSSEVLIAEGWQQILHPDDREEYVKAWDKAVSSAREFVFEHRLLRHDGIYRWQLTRATPQKSSDGTTQMWVGTITDIEDQKTFTTKLETEIQNRTRELKALNETLAKSEERYHLMVEEVQDYAILYLNREGTIENWNKGAEKIKGYHASEIIGKSFTVFYTAEDRERNLPFTLLERAVKTGKARQEGWRVRKDGTLFWASVTITAVHNADGEVIGFSKVTHDLTEKKQTDEQLQQSALQLKEKNAELEAVNDELQKLNETLAKSEERYHLMVEEVQDYAILYLNRDGTVENWNKGAEKIKGYHASEIIGKSFSVFYSAEDRARNLPFTLLDRALHTGRAQQEGWRVRKDGTNFWASVTITAVHNNKGEVIGFSKVTHDLSEKKKTDEKLRDNARQLQEKNVELEKMNKELESFAYVSSHDLQEPLRKIQTFSSRIQEMDFDTLSDNAKDNFQRMQGAAKRMQVLIEDLLVYSRTSDTERKYVKTDLGKLMEEVREDIADQLAAKNATLTVGDLCKADIIPFQFRQMMQNLLGNSLKFAREGVPAIISIHGESRKGSDFNNRKLENDTTYCHLSIKDNGIGFDPEYSEKIFEVFQRLHGKNEYVGTGIGLAIVKKIVDNLHGVITATGVEGQGATFDLYFPVSATKT